jgi:hypothetical protein
MISRVKAGAQFLSTTKNISCLTRLHSHQDFAIRQRKSFWCDSATFRPLLVSAPLY